MGSKCKFLFSEMHISLRETFVNNRRNRCERLGCRLSEEPKQVAQLSQRDRAAVWVSYGQSERLELRDNILRT